MTISSSTTGISSSSAIGISSSSTIGISSSTSSTTTSSSVAIISSVTSSSAISSSRYCSASSTLFSISVITSSSLESKSSMTASFFSAIASLASSMAWRALPVMSFLSLTWRATFAAPATVESAPIPASVAPVILRALEAVGEKTKFLITSSLELLVWTPYTVAMELTSLRSRSPMSILPRRTSEIMSFIRWSSGCKLAI